MPLMAACASASEPISTKPKPFERPVSRSIMTLADVTVPNWPNACCRSSSRTPLRSLNEVLGSIEAVRNGRALYVLLATFSVAGLLLAMAETALARDNALWGALQGGAALTAAFYGSNAAGLLIMDQTRGQPLRDVGQALRDALATAHRLLVVALLVLLTLALLVAALLLPLAASRLPLVGPWIFALTVPVGVVLLGAAALR